MTRTMMGEYKRLLVWKKADLFAKKVYMSTDCFPKVEVYGIVSQLRRAALSVPTNIVEGYARKSESELAHFLNISYGSLAEVEYLLSFSADMNFLSRDEYRVLEMLRKEVGALLWSFKNKVDQSVR